MPIYRFNITNDEGKAFSYCLEEIRNNGKESFCLKRGKFYYVCLIKKTVVKEETGRKIWSFDVNVPLDKIQKNSKRDYLATVEALAKLNEIYKVE